MYLHTICTFVIMTPKIKDRVLFDVCVFDYLSLEEESNAKKSKDRTEQLKKLGNYLST